MTNSTSDEREQRLNNHMARLGAGLLLLKEKLEAPITRPISYCDHVQFQFEGEEYLIVSAVCDPTQTRRAIWRKAIAAVKQYAGSCPGHAQLQMFAALEAAANETREEVDHER